MISRKIKIAQAIMRNNDIPSKLQKDCFKSEEGIRDMCSVLQDIRETNPYTYAVISNRNEGKLRSLAMYDKVYNPLYVWEGV